MSDDRDEPPPSPPPSGPRPLKHVYDHKRRVHAASLENVLSDDTLTPNEEEMMKIIEDLRRRLEDLESKR